MTNTIKWDKPCYKCLSHFCDLSCEETSKTEEQDDEVLGFNGWGFPIEKPNKVMTTQTEALNLAISRLEWFIDSYPHDITTSKEDFLRPFKEALAQPEQEPVAWAMLHDNGDFIDAINPEEHARIEGDYKHALYTTPPQRTAAVGEDTRRAWVGLTEEEVIDLWPDLIMHRHTYKFWQNLEAKLKEKNT